MRTGQHRGSLKRLLVISVIAAGVVASCGGARPSTASSSPETSFATRSAAPTETAGMVPIEPSPTVRPSPTASAVPDPTPTPPIVATPQWSKPQRVAKADCQLASVALEDGGRTHVASECNGSIQVSVSNGTRWESTRLPRPTDRMDQGAQLAFDDGVMYLAFTRVKVEDGGCGDSGMRDVGVYIRQRQLPSGDWSSARRIGSPTDGLLALRVAGGVVHATVKDRADGHLYYERVDNGALARYRLPGAIDGGSLRVGDDGRARVVYEGERNLQFATFNGSGFSHASIPASSLGWGGSLVLDAQNHAHVLWTRSYHGGGCAEPEPESWFGTYYGTNETGAWSYRRISTSTNGGSITLDADSGQIHVAIAGQFGIRYLTKTAHGPWRTVRITNHAGWSPIIKLDPGSGKLVIVYAGEDEQIYAVTRAEPVTTGCGC